MSINLMSFPLKVNKSMKNIWSCYNQSTKSIRNARNVTPSKITILISFKLVMTILAILLFMQVPENTDQFIYICFTNVLLDAIKFHHTTLHETHERSLMLMAGKWLFAC